MPDTPRAAALRATLAPPVLRSAVGVMLVVGTLLNLINQHDVLSAGGPVDWFKLGLTYVVPFCVSLYGAYAANRARPG